MKILFITSLDFGEMSLATCFARNQPFQTVFAVPEKKVAYFDEVVDAVHAYSSINELQSIVQKEKPDVVSLNTAYLLVNDGLATMNEFKLFIQFLIEFGFPIITTDPFARVFDSYPRCSFEMNGILLEELNADMMFLSNYLKNLPHVYGFPSSASFKNAYTFYNNKYCINNKIKETEKKDYWLFVLGELDGSLLLAQYGGLFIKELAKRLKEICGNGENIVRCVFPTNIAWALRQVLLPELNTLQILDFVTLNEFEKLISESKAVFYWNIFSNSILLCYYYNVPFLFFGKGHMASLSVDLFEHMSTGIYRNGKPEFIDFFLPMEPCLNVLLQKNYSQENRQHILDQYHCLQTPQSIIETLINA